MKNSIKVGSISIGGDNPLVIIAGPCVIEDKETTLYIARYLKELAQKLDISLIFKASYDKANRTSINSFRGPGLAAGLQILDQIKKDLGLVILSDVHSINEIDEAAKVLDIIQIPAFLCRQTDLLIAAGKTGRVVNIKKGQFLAPDDMKHPIEKVASTKNENILVTERGTTFGYHNLVVDMRGLVVMKKFGYPVVLDATHSVQLPSGENGKSGGQPEFIFPLSRAGAAVGIDALFIETHPEPAKALSDAASQLPLSELENLVKQVTAIDNIMKDVTA